MRFYQIFISDESGPLGQVAVKNWSSFVNGQTVPGALNVEFDFPLYNYAAPLGGCFLKVWGISLQDISQAADLNGLSIRIYGGMAKGLPLANPQQSGLLLAGTIQQCFGNWIGTEQNVNFLIQYGGDLGGPDAPRNIVLNWPAGTGLGVAVDSALRVAFPTLNVDVSISENLVRANDEIAYFESPQQFAAYLVDISKATIGGNYRGVQMTLRNGGFVVYDETGNIAGVSAANPKVIEFNDLIGQPTWLGFGQVNLKLVMRADIQVGDFIRMPAGPVITLPQSFSQYRDKSAFQGVFQITQLRHLGNFRQSDAGSWVTVVDAVVAGES